ncbi:ABC transporter G family member 22-like [Salvia splendens]|uniref:ABC transporter G family member 22-like n=1 Tax=Salvia splendens TaxID=180675 RepID=UPI001C2789FD|nr:ABC transporter G family member 22-like [Salvia splendens]
MEKTANSTTSLIRTKSDQLVETIAAALGAMKSPASSGDAAANSSGNLSRISSRRLTEASPGRNTHIRKSRSAQLKFDVEDLSGGAALSLASSASLGFSFSGFASFTVPADDFADSKPFSDDEIDYEKGG